MNIRIDQALSIMGAVRSLARPWRLLAGWLLACDLFAASAIAGTLTTDFRLDPGGTVVKNRDYSELIEGGMLKLVDLSDLIDPDTGLLSVARMPLQGSYIFPDFNGGQKIASFTATFKVRVGGGTETGGEGFSMILANDISDAAPFRESGGTTTGLTISFDELDGRAPEAGAAGVTEGNDPGDAPGIIIKQGGRKIVAKRFANLRSDGRAPTTRRCSCP